MDINVRFEYLEGYLPTPRSRKERFRAIQDVITVPLKEVSMDDLRLAYRINGDTEIYAYQDQLYRMIPRGCDNNMGWRMFHYKDNPLEYLQEVCLNVENMFCPTSQADRREKIEARIRGYLSLFLVADGVLFVKSPKPVYVVESSGTPFLPNASTYMNVYYQHEHRQFPATDPEAAAKCAAEIAANHGCINLYGNGYKPRIEVFPGAGESMIAPAGFDADDHRLRLLNLCRYNKNAISLMKPICEGTCRYISKDPGNLDLYCNQCKALQTVLNLTNSLSAAEACIYSIEDAVDRSNPNSFVSSTVEQWEKSRKEGVSK